MPLEDTPQPLPPDGEGEVAAPESVLCPHCAGTNPPMADFCSRCGAPLSVMAMTDPLRETRSAGFLYREATKGAPKPIVVVGIWLIFLPGLASLPFAWGSGITDRTELGRQGVFSLLSTIVPVLATMNFIRKRRVERAMDNSPDVSQRG